MTLSGLAGSVGAQQTLTVSIQLPVRPVARVDVSRKVVDLGTPTESAFGSSTASTGSNFMVSVKSNMPYALTMSANAANFVYQGPYAASPSRREKPVSDLRYGTGTSCVPTSQASTSGARVLQKASVGSGDGTVAGGADAISICLGTIWSFDRDVPGNYSAGLKFTLSAP